MNILKRDEILQVVQENIDDLRLQERTGGVAWRDSQAKSRAGAISRPKPPPQRLDEMDGIVAGLHHPFRQAASEGAVQGVDALIDMELERIRQGVRSLGQRAGAF